MVNYKILIKPSAVKELTELPKKDIQRITKKIHALSSVPRPPGCEKLSGEEKYKIRQGNYRIIYLIGDNQLIIVVIKIGHRKHVYKKR